MLHMFDFSVHHFHVCLSVSTILSNNTYAILHKILLANVLHQLLQVPRNVHCSYSSYSLYFHTNINPFNFWGDCKNLYGNFMALVFSVKPHLIRNRLSVNTINNKLVTSLQITLTADHLFSKQILACLQIPGLFFRVQFEKTISIIPVNNPNSCAPYFRLLSLDFPEITRVPWDTGLVVK